MGQADGEKGPGTDQPSRDVVTAIVAVAAVGLTSSIIAGVGWGLSGFLGVFLGASIAVANLYVFKKLGESFFTVSGGNRATWGLIGILKVVVLGALVFFVLRHHIVEALPFVIGYAALPVGITLSSLLGARYDGDKD